MILILISHLGHSLMKEYAKDIKRWVLKLEYTLVFDSEMCQNRTCNIYILRFAEQIYNLLLTFWLQETQYMANIACMISMLPIC